MRKKISYAIKCLIVIATLVGVTVALITYSRDGYSHPAKRLLYFTTLSNVWLGLTFLYFVIAPLLNKNEKVEQIFYLLKYVFTVSITITGLVFCVLLAPFVTDGYHPWSLSSVLTHVVAPLLAIADLFVDPREFVFRYRYAVYTIIPPLVYFIFAGILGALKIDFGRGDAYPYFFMNFYSPVGIFGVGGERPFVIGTFYWVLLFLGLVLTIATLYAVLHHTTISRIKQRREERKKQKTIEVNKEQNSTLNE